MFEEFKRHYPEQSNNHKNTYEWVTLMQHYGLPTRLLDWSGNLLVGLYFCCINDSDKDGVIFIFDPTYLDENYKFNELLEMQVQEKSRDDFFHRIIYQLDDVLDGSCKLNGISIQVFEMTCSSGHNFAVFQPVVQHLLLAYRLR
ncbi:hypothetical protein GCM10007905_11970 [Mixta theicola]|nr:hypothetical protein GCM10007905_11970 [Mixta theicola]